MPKTMTSFNQDQQNAAARSSGSATATTAIRGGTPASASVPSADRTIDVADGTTAARHGTAKIRSSSTSKDGISWECGNLLHFEDINNAVEDDDDSSVSSDDSWNDVDNDNDNDNAPKNPNSASTSTGSRRTHAVNNDLANAFSTGLTMRRTSSVESFQQKIIQKHTSSGSLTRVSSLHASSGNGNGGSSLRSYLSFGRGPDAAGGAALRTATGTTSGTGAGSNSNFGYQRGNDIGSSQSRRNANASSAGRALLDRRN